MNFFKTDFQKNEVVGDIDPIKFLISGILYDLIRVRFK